MKKAVLGLLISTFGSMIVAGCQTTGLNLPKNAEKPVPAVVLVGGTGGSGGRYEYHGPALQDAGFAVYYANYWPPNYSFGRGSAEFVGHAFATLKELQKNPAIDPNRVAIMGFSRGGRVAMLVADGFNKDQYMGQGKGFAAHVAFYPACGGVDIVRETGAPILIIAGDKDELDDEKLWCPVLAESLNGENSKIAEVTIYPGAGHAFDSDFSKFTPNPSAAADSRERSVAFLKRVLMDK